MLDRPNTGVFNLKSFVMPWFQTGDTMQLLIHFMYWWFRCVMTEENTHTTYSSWCLSISICAPGSTWACSHKMRTSSCTNRWAWHHVPPRQFAIIFRLLLSHYMAIKVSSDGFNTGENKLFCLFIFSISPPPPLMQLSMCHIVMVIFPFIPIVFSFTTALYSFRVILLKCTRNLIFRSWGRLIKIIWK